MPETFIVLPSKPHAVTENEFNGVYEIKGLYPGYGHTLGNSLRRIILSSLPGTAITTVKIDGANNEFTTIDGIQEDVITILLNLKNVRIKMETDEPQTLTLKSKGEKTVTAREIETSGHTTVMNPDHEIAHMTTKNAELNIEMTVERGLGYVPKEALAQDRSEIGLIKMDAVFTPVRRVNYEVENMRVGDRTDYNKVILTIETDGTISPRESLDQSIAIMHQQVQALMAEYGEDEPREDKIEYTVSSPESDEDVNEKAEPADKEDDGDETEFLKTRIEQLDLSRRTLNALSGANIRTVGGLARKKESDIREIEGLGDKGIEEIKELLEKNDLELKE